MSTCNPCVSLPCSNQSDLTIYSLQTGIQFTNNTAISIIVECPAGSTCVGFPKTVTYPPGTFVFNQPDPNPPSGTVLRLNGCLGAVTRIVPADATAADIAALVREIIQEAAEQQAQCDTIDSNPPPITPVLNDARSQVIDCDEGEGTVFTGTLPSYITLDGGTNTFTINAGIFAGTSKSDANSKASAFLASFIAENEDSIECVGCDIIVVAIGPPTEGEPYSQVIVQTGFSSPFWSISAGALPSGLSINSSTGEIAGTPTECGGPFTFTVRAAYEEDSDIYCEHEFSFNVDCLFGDLVWTGSNGLVGAATANQSGDGNGFHLECTMPSVPVSRAVANLQGDMIHVGTGSVIPCKVVLNTTRNGGQTPSGSNYIQVRVDNSLVLNKPGLSGITSTGTYEFSFNLPATTETVRINLKIDMASVQVEPIATYDWTGSFQFDPP